MTTQPLTGCSVVLTRQPDSNRELASLLDSAGAGVVEVPLVSFAPPVDAGVGLRRAVAELESDAWLAVLSPVGARHTMTILVEQPVVRLCVVGEGTASVFRAAGWNVDLVAEEESAVGLAADLLASAPSGRVVAAQSDIGRPDLAVALERAGWKVGQVTAYCNVEPDDVNAVDVAAAAGADVVVFASPSAVSRFVEHCGTRPTTAVCFGSTTAAAASAAGFEPSVAGGPSDEGVYTAIVAALTGGA